MRWTLKVCSAVATFLSLGATGFAGDVVVFDNTAQSAFQGPFLFITEEGEGGDQIDLDPAVPTYELTHCTMYMGSFLSGVFIDMTLNIVLNDGPGGEPGTVLWSGTLIDTLVSGGGVWLKEFDIPNIVVPSSFSVIVDVSYLDPSQAGSAGIMTFDPPTVGSSDPEWVWGRDLLGQPAATWQQIPPQPGFAANIGARFRGVPGAATAPQFRRGDCDNNGSVSGLVDGIFLLNYLFGGAASNDPQCLDACDGDDSDSLNLSDALAILLASFGSPPQPLPVPGVTCGVDPAGTTLGCVSPSCP